MKRVLNAVTASALVIIPLTLVGYVLVFRLVTMPSAAGESTSHALVLKWYGKDQLKTGDMVWVELDDEQAKPLRTIQQIQRVDMPDPSQRPKALGRRTARPIAQAILDMDFKPKYAVSTLDDTNHLRVVTQWRIKGVVIHVFGRSK